MVAKNTMPQTQDQGAGTNLENHPVIRTLYDHMEVRIHTEATTNERVFLEVVLTPLPQMEEAPGYQVKHLKWAHRFQRLTWLTWLVERTKERTTLNNVPSPKKQRSCRLSGSSENRAFEKCRSTDFKGLCECKPNWDFQRGRSGGCLFPSPLD